MASTSPIYTVLGATGHIGSRVSSLLLSSGQRVRAVVRSKMSEKAKEIESKGAELWLVESKEGGGKTLNANLDALSAALTGADAAFIMIPPNLHAENPEEDAKQYVETLKRAVEVSKIEKLVLLSSIGAHMEVPVGGVQPLKFLEDAFKPLERVQKTFVRVSYFYLNVLPNLEPSILSLGFFPYTFSPDSLIPLVSQDDISDQVVTELQLLTSNTHFHDLNKTLPPQASDQANAHTPQIQAPYSSNKFVELSGPEDLTFEQVSSFISDILHQPIVYLPIPFEKQDKIWQTQGCSRQGALDFVNMYSSFSSYTVSWQHPQSLIRGKRLFKDYLASVIVPNKE